MRLYEMDYGAYRPCPTELKVESQEISFFHPFIPGEKKSVKTFLVRILFYVQSKGNFRIYYVRGDEENKPIHTSYVCGASAKFPFMGKTDIHIGPCYTDADHRGKGIYRKVLKAIHAENCGAFSRAYMIVDEENLPSIKGIEAAGLRQVGSVERQGLRKIYRRV